MTRERQKSASMNAASVPWSEPIASCVLLRAMCALMRRSRVAFG